MKHIYLASKSPRRYEIIKKLYSEFTVISSDYKESLSDIFFDYKKIEKLALNKAFGAINNINKDGFIISADTVVVLENNILLKPKDYDDAFNILKSLSDKEHFVVTSLCILDKETKEYILQSTTTYVRFNKLTDNMIKNYIDKFKPFDKAGAYGIQELPEEFVNSVNGDIENVIGLSSKSVQEAISVLQNRLN